jgi:hypothetical protein
MNAVRRGALVALVTGLLAGPMPGMGAGPARAEGLWSTYLRMNTVQDVLALRDTVWLATQEAGLVRYQRSTGTWSTITREPGGLAGNDVRAIAFDRTGNLFAAVPGKGLSRLDLDGRWSLINAFDGLPSDTVLALQAYGDTIWIGTTRGLAFWDGETVAGSVPDLGTTSPFSNNIINGIAVLGDTLVASNPDGIYVARLSQRLSPWTLVSGTIQLNNKVVRGIASDGRDLLALVSGKNITTGGDIFTSFRWSPGTNSWPVEAPAASVAVRRLRDDHGIIVATTLAGTHIRNGQNAWADVPDLPATNNDDSRAVEPGSDPDRNVFAAQGGQLHETGQPPRTPPGPIANTCRNVTWSDGSVYVAYEGAGISRLRDGVWRNYPPRSCIGAECDTTFAFPVYPAGMLVDSLGIKWIANWAGPLTRFDDEVQPPFFHNIPFASSNPDSAHLHSCIHAMSTDSTRGSQAGIWCGLDSDRIGQENGNPIGLDLYDRNGNFLRNYGTTYPGLRNGLIRGVACDRTNTMWVGYKGSSGAGLSTFAVPDSLHRDIALSDVSGTNLMDVFGIDIRGDSVWVLATDNLYRYRVGARTRASELAIAGPPALAGMHPLAVAANGTVFVGTTGGLRVHRRGFPPVDYTPDNSPLADLEVRAVYCEPSGAAWIATARGLNRFDPEFLPPPEPTLPSLQVRLWPNPAWLTGAGFQLRLAGEASSYVGEVHDLTGRVVHRFSVGGNGAVVWDGRDLHRRAVEPGIYFVRVRGGGAEATSRVVVLR